MHTKLKTVNAFLLLHYYLAQKSSSLLTTAAVTVDPLGLTDFLFFNVSAAISLT